MFHRDIEKRQRDRKDRDGERWTEREKNSHTEGSERDENNERKKRRETTDNTEKVLFISFPFFIKEMKKRYISR